MEQFIGQLLVHYSVIANVQLEIFHMILRQDIEFFNFYMRNIYYAHEISQIRHVICGLELIQIQMFSSGQCLKMVSMFFDSVWVTVFVSWDARPRIFDQPMNSKTIF